MLVKLHMDNDLRRISIDDGSDFVEFRAQVLSLFRLDSSGVALKYVDEDGDLVTLSNQVEFEEAMHHASELDKPLLRVHVVPVEHHTDATSFSFAQAPVNDEPFVFDTMPLVELSASSNIDTSEQPVDSTASEDVQSEQAVNSEQLPFEDEFLYEDVPSVEVEDVTEEQNYNYNNTPEEEEEEEEEVTVSMDIKLNELLDELKESLGVSDVAGAISVLQNNPERMVTLMDKVMDKVQRMPMGHEILAQILADPSCLSLTGTGPLFEPQSNSSSGNSSGSSSSSSSSSDESGKVLHHRVSCNVCGVGPIAGVRWKCTTCFDFDLCDDCEQNRALEAATLGHDVSHTMLKIRVSEFEAPQQKQEDTRVVHVGITCDGCGQSPLRGDRFKCSECWDYDLCEDCEEAGVTSANHKATHAMARHVQPVVRHWHANHPTPGGGCHRRAGAHMQSGAHHPFAMGLQQFAQQMFGHQANSWAQQQQQQHQQHQHQHQHQQQQGARGQDMVNNMFEQWCNHRKQASKPKLSARFVEDVTIDDGMTLAPNAQFTKIWRVFNASDEAWPEHVRLVWASGDHLLAAGAAQEVVVDAAQAKSALDVALDFVAPSVPGSYRATYRFVAPNGDRFGSRVWVHINVKEEEDEVDEDEDEDISQLPVAEVVGDEPVVLSHADLFAYAEELQHLEEMGFNDTAHNKALLIQHEGSIEKVLLDLFASSFSF